MRLSQGRNKDTLPLLKTEPIFFLFSFLVYLTQGLCHGRTGGSVTSNPERGIMPLPIPLQYEKMSHKEMPGGKKCHGTLRDIAFTTAIAAMGRVMSIGHDIQVLHSCRILVLGSSKSLSFHLNSF